MREKDRAVLPIEEALRLRSLELRDADALFGLIDAERDYLGRWLPFVEATRGPQDTAAYVRSVTEPPGDAVNLVFVIERAAQVVGLIGLKDIDGRSGRAELGYWLSERHQRQGIVTRAAWALCGRAFREIGLNRVQICCAVGNVRSRQIPLRLGFTLEGVAREAERFEEGRFVDLEVFSLLRREFEQRG